MLIFIDQPSLNNSGECHTEPMANQNPNGVVFLATVLSKMSQMFTQINSMYLQAILDKDSLQLTPPSTTDRLNTLPNNQNEIMLDEIASGSDSLESNSDHEKPSLSHRQEKGKRDSIMKSDGPKRIEIKQVMSEPPRPPPSSYLLFFKQHKEKISQEFPTLNVTELSKIASKCWKELTEQEKKPYHEKFNKQKQRYYEALKAYNTKKRQSEPKVRGRKPKKDANDHKKETCSKKKATKGKLNSDSSDSHCDSSFSI